MGFLQDNDYEGIVFMGHDGNDDWVFVWLFSLHLCWYGGNDGKAAGCVWSFALAIISHVPFTTWAIVASIVFLFDILRLLYVAWNLDCLIQR